MSPYGGQGTGGGVREGVGVREWGLKERGVSERERATQQNYENEDCEIKHFSTFPALWTSQREEGCNLLNPPPGYASEIELKTIQNYTDPLTNVNLHVSTFFTVLFTTFGF